MITLANDKPVKGTFELRRPSGSVNGAIDVYLKWRYTYLPASAKPRAVPQRVMRVPDDNEPFSSDSEPEFKPVVKSPSKREKPPSPVDSSTPKQEQRGEKVARRESAQLAQLQRKPSDLKEKTETRVEEKKTEKPVEFMSVDELVEATAQKPQPAPRTRRVELEKPVEEMSIDEIAKAVEETREEHGDQVKSTGEISETSEDEQNDEALVAEEMRRTTEAAASEDTMFEEQHSESDFDSTLGEEVDIPFSAAESKEELDEEAEEIEEEMDEEDEEEDEKEAGEEESKEKREKEDTVWESGTETSENEVVVSPRHSRAKSVVKPASTVVVQVTSLTLDSEAPILQDPNVKQLFIAYKFLDYDPADLETPVSLPKPAPNRPIYYNFKKVFHVDAEENQGKRNYLFYMLCNDPKLVFTVVSDPPEGDDEGDCVDVAYASVDFVQILNEGDYVDTDIALYDIESNSKMGTLTVSVEASEALLELYEQ